MIHSVDEGPRDAPALLFSHSLGTNHHLFDAQAAALRDRHRVVRYDARGHGASARPPGPYDVATLAADVLELADRLQIERFHFIGLSMGGQVGLWLALHAPARLHRLVLANTAARIGVPEVWNARIATLQTEGSAAVVDGAVERALTAAFRDRDPETTARLRGWLGATHPEGYASACAAVRDCDLRGEVAAITTPTLVISGSHDVGTPPADGRWLAERIPGARYHELDAAHLSNLEAGPAFDAAVAAFTSSQEIPWTNATATTRG